jgi:methionyl-tRNA formyltransferase
VRLSFLGSGAFAIPSFQALLAGGHEVAGLVTQPDRARGRGMAVGPSPLKRVALAHGIRVLQPPRIREVEAKAALETLGAEIQVVVAYGQILPRAVLDIPPRGTINVHASLLPRYRGAAPIQWAIVRGETVTGVTTMLLDEGLDTGPILLARAVPIEPEETTPELEPRLARHGAELLLETLRGMQDGSVRPTAQDASAATLAPRFEKADGVLSWSEPAEDIARRVRGLQPWPGTTSLYEGRALKVLRARVSGTGQGEPGTVLAAGAEGILVACGAGSRLLILEVQPESRRPMSAASFVAGARLRPGHRLG